MELKLLLKRGALLAAANWQTVAIQLVAETTLYAMLTVPLIGAAILVALLLGADVANLLQGSINDMFTTIADALRAEPITLVSFVASFSIALLGGSMLMFLVKGGIVEVFLASQAIAGPIEREPIHWENIRSISCFTMPRFLAGCMKHFRRYLALGLILMLIYGISGAACIAFLVYGYQTAGDGVLMIGWAAIAALAVLLLEVWITAVNVVYLLLQIAIAAEDLGLLDACRVTGHLIRARFRELGGVFLVVLVMIVGATFASALAWSGVGLVAFIPLIGLAVFPLQIFALLLRGLVFDYIGLTALGSYITLFRSQQEAATIIVAGASASHPAT